MSTPRGISPQVPTESNRAAAAQRLAAAARTRTSCAPVRDLIGSDDVVAAYAVQEAVIADRLAAGAVVLATDPVAGPLDDEQVRAAVDYAVAAIEIVDSRIAGWDITFPDTVADNGSSGLFVLGTRIRPAAARRPGDLVRSPRPDGRPRRPRPRPRRPHRPRLRHRDLHVIHRVGRGDAWFSGCVGSTEQVIAFLRRPSGVAEIQSGTQIFGRPELREFLDACGDYNAALHELTPVLPACDDFHAGALAMLCGALVERGGDAGAAVTAVVELLERQLRLVAAHPVEPVEESFRQHPDAVRAHYGLPFTLLAAMTMLCRRPEARIALRRNADLVDLIHDSDVESYETLHWLRQVVKLVDDGTLLLVDPEARRGFVLRLTGVRTVMAHIYALATDTLLRHTGADYLDAAPAAPGTVRYARNVGMTPEDYLRRDELLDQLRIGFYYPGIDRSAPGGPRAVTALWISTTADFDGLRRTAEGHTVVFIGKRSIQSGWCPANLYPVIHEALEASATLVRELPQAEIDAWLARFVQHFP